MSKFYVSLKPNGDISAITESSRPLDFQIVEMEDGPGGQLLTITQVELDLENSTEEYKAASFEDKLTKWSIVRDPNPERRPRTPAGIEIAKCRKKPNQA